MYKSVKCNNLPLYCDDIAMNNEEQDVKKKIMMVVGACLFLIAAAQALPMFFGL